MSFSLPKRFLPINPLFVACLWPTMLSLMPLVWSAPHVPICHQHQQFRSLHTIQQTAIINRRFFQTPGHSRIEQPPHQLYLNVSTYHHTIKVRKNPVSTKLKGRYLHIKTINFSKQLQACNQFDLPISSQTFATKQQSL